MLLKYGDVAALEGGLEAEVEAEAIGDAGAWFCRR